MDPEMAEKIASVLNRVKDPESGLSVEAVGCVTRVRYNEEKGNFTYSPILSATFPAALPVLALPRPSYPPS